jgi:hypothetical protein
MVRVEKKKWGNKWNVENLKLSLLPPDLEVLSYYVQVTEGIVMEF